MKKVMVDTNILVDLIADRKPHSKFAIDLFHRAEDKQIKLFTSSHTLATTHYLLKKYVSEKDLREILLNVMDFITIIPIDSALLRKGLRSKHKDFEDALQIICASSVVGMDYIVTRNVKDFKSSEVRVIPPDELINELNNY
jgi:predicted nucleic acid-binding protein